MTDHPQAAVDALTDTLADALFSMMASNIPRILDAIAPLLTAELDTAYAEAHACGAERETWKDRAEAAEAKLALAMRALLWHSDDSSSQGDLARAALSAIKGETK